MTVDDHGSDELASEIFVTGMTCGHCAQSVTRELTAIESVTDVAIDLKAGGTSRVTICSQAPLADADVAAAVEEAGYALATS